MACSACAARRTQSQRSVSEIRPRTDRTQPCDYNIETIDSWKSKLQCASDAGILIQFSIQKALFNSFMGILLSIQKNPDQICYYKKELDIIQPYIINIINSEAC